MRRKLALTVSSFMVALTLLLSAAPMAHAAGTASAENCQSQARKGMSFLYEFPTWYKYLELDTTTCEVKDFEVPGDIWKIGIAVVEILLRVAGMVAFFYVIYAGFKFVMSRGNPSEAAKARQALIDAIIGVAITSIAVVLVAFLGNELTKK